MAEERLLTVKHGEQAERLRNDENVEHEPCMNKYVACETSTVIKGKGEWQHKYPFLSDVQPRVQSPYPSVLQQQQQQQQQNQQYQSYQQHAQHAQHSQLHPAPGTKKQKNKNKKKNGKRGKNGNDETKNGSNNNGGSGNNSAHLNGQGNIHWVTGDDTPSDGAPLNASNYVLHAVDCGILTNFRDHMPKPIKLHNKSPYVIVVTSVRVVPRVTDTHFYQHIDVRTRLQEVCHCMSTLKNNCLHIFFLE